MIKQVAAVAVAGFAVGLVPVVSAQAASSPSTAKPLPNPCRTFTVKSARALLRVSPGTHLSEKLTRSNKPFPVRTCTIRHGKTTLVVQVQRQPGGTGSEENCYTRPRLGPHGTICVSIPKSPPFSVVTFRKHGIWVADGINVMLPNRGRRLLDFALPQYKSFTG